MKIVLASASPRRAKILESLGIDFETIKTGASEISLDGDPERTVRENALSKGAAAKGRRHVLSADTIVWFDGRIYGKPRDFDEAKRFLHELSGKTHSVFTGVAFDGKAKVVRSDVKFKDLDEKTIEEYVARIRPLDRAGAYDIDESGDLIVESYTGSYENIMGLPVEPLVEWGIVPPPKNNKGQ
jgi:septum formation protein